MQGWPCKHCPRAVESPAACQGILVVQDIDSLVLLARRRARDEKATVRRSGLQLTEGLLLMRIRGDGGASPELPNQADIEVIEAATSHPLARPRSHRGSSRVRTLGFSQV